MKNFLSLDNLIFQEKEPISNFIQSSSEVSECSITNVLEENSSSIWISNEELPQEIILNLSRSFFKEYPKKLSAIGIYCWHAYPTNPKLVEILISKNNDDNFISFGNFDLCLKPGRQLLQLDEENDSNFLNTENNNYIIKILIKETFGDKRTYINNIYLYENIDFMGSGIINSFNPNDTIKEEDDSSSIFYLRESRERTLPRKKINNSINNNTITSNKINNDTLTNNNIQIQSQSQINPNFNNNNNIMIKVHSDELKNKDLTIDEFEIITKTKNKGNKSSEKLNINNKNINSENILIKNNYENDESNILINNNIIGTESQFNITEFSERNNLIKNEDITNQNILLTKTNDDIDEKLNNSNNKNADTNKQLNENNIDNKLNKKTSNVESLDVSLSSDDLENFGILKGTKTHHNNFFNPPKISESTDELDNFEFQHSSGDNKLKNKIDISDKKIMENYFNMQNSSNKNSISNNNRNVNCLSQKNIQKENNDIIIPKEKNKNINKKREKEEKEKEIKQLKEEICLIKNEYENYKKEQQEINRKYQEKILLLEKHIKKLTTNSNKMNDVLKTLLEAQYIQNQNKNDIITNQMRRIATETFVNIFSNITQFANLPQQQNPVISIPNPNQEPIDNININNLNDKERQQTYQTTRRKKYSIDRINKKINNKSSNNIEIDDSKDSNKGNKIYNKKINETNIKANKLKKYNSGRNIVLRKNYISQNNINNCINPEIKNNYINNESSENNIDNIDNNDKEQINDHYFYQTGYPTDGDKNKTPFQKVQKINNINSNEILKINNNDFHNNILSNRKEIVHKRLLSNYYKKKTSSPLKK